MSKDLLLAKRIRGDRFWVYKRKKKWSNWSFKIF